MMVVMICKKWCAKGYIPGPLSKEAETVKVCSKYIQCQIVPFGLSNLVCIVIKKTFILYLGFIFPIFGVKCITYGEINFIDFAMFLLILNNIVYCIISNEFDYVFFIEIF